MATVRKIDSDRVNYPIYLMLPSNYPNRYNTNEKIEWFLVDGEITENNISQINSYRGTPRVLIFKNTCGQNSEMIKKINNPNVKLSVMGGLDYLSKRKFNNDEYIDRTFYTPDNLAEIISIYEKIERQIRPTWTDTQKCMFVYRKIIKVMHYKYDNESSHENGVDVTRSLNSLIARRAVCSGFALIFKEAMDRLGIECVYQNRDHHHSWNVVKLDGKWRALDLTWDVYNKNNGGISYFGLQSEDDFYSNPHHDLNTATEEVRYPCQEFNRDELIEDMRVTEYKGLEMERDTEQFGQYHIARINNVAVGFDGRRITAVPVQPNDTKEQIRRNVISSFGNPQQATNRVDFNTYYRSDGSSFIIVTTGKHKKQTHEYALIDFSDKNGKMQTNISIILSENDLIRCSSPQMYHSVANYLLSPSRLKRKMQNFNGYVGYIGADTKLYYDSNFEHDELNIQHR